MVTSKTIPDMKEIFRQAAEIAQQVPESMQVAAFNRASRSADRCNESGRTAAECRRTSAANVD